MVLVTLDVKNAFNSARWKLVMSELERRAAPPYLLNIVANYLHHSLLLVEEKL